MCGRSNFEEKSAYLWTHNRCITISLCFTPKSPHAAYGLPRSVLTCFVFACLVRSCSWKSGIVNEEFRQLFECQYTLPVVDAQPIAL